MAALTPGGGRGGEGEGERPARGLFTVSTDKVKDELLVVYSITDGPVIIYRPGGWRKI